MGYRRLFSRCPRTSVEYRDASGDGTVSIARQCGPDSRFLRNLADHARRRVGGPREHVHRRNDGRLPSQLGHRRRLRHAVLAARRVESAQAHPGDDTIVVPGRPLRAKASIGETPSSLNLADRRGGRLADDHRRRRDADGHRRATAPRPVAPNDDRAMTIEPTIAVSISHLEVTGGVADDTNNFYGGDIANFGTLALDHVWLTGGSGILGGRDHEPRRRPDDLQQPDLRQRGRRSRRRRRRRRDRELRRQRARPDGDHEHDDHRQPARRAGAITSPHTTSGPRRSSTTTRSRSTGQAAGRQRGPRDRRAARRQDAGRRRRPEGTIVYGNTATFLDPSTTAPQNCGTSGGTIVSAGGNVGGSVAECALS